MAVEPTLSQNYTLYSSFEITQVSGTLFNQLLYGACEGKYSRVAETQNID